MYWSEVPCRINTDTKHPVPYTLCIFVSTKEKTPKRYVLKKRWPAIIKSPPSIDFIVTYNMNIQNMWSWSIMHRSYMRMMMLATQQGSGHNPYIPCPCSVLLVGCVSIIVLLIIAWNRETHGVRGSLLCYLLHRQKETRETGGKKSVGINSGLIDLSKHY